MRTGKEVFCLIILAVIILLSGCKKDDEPGPNHSTWNVTVVWPHGSHPVPAPEQDAVLFMQEEAPAGLYLLRSGFGSRINPNGPDVQPDYSWSPDGSQFAISAANQSGGANSGIFMAALATPMAFTQLWDRGNHPRFLRDMSALVCAGPEDGSDAQGIWQIDLTSHQRARIAPVGTQPEISPDGLKISYLVEGTIFGRLLVVLDRTTGVADTLTGATSVLQYSWLGTSDAIVFERDTALVPEIMISYLGSSSPPQFLVYGIYPAGFSSGNNFVYTGMQGDRNDGLFSAAPDRTPARMTTRGTLARPAAPVRIYAQDSTGILRIDLIIPPA
jgi:hypothetical protein